MTAPYGVPNAQKRGHLLTISKSDDWTEDDPYWDWSVTCSTPVLCGGWTECRDEHEVDGVSAESGPYDADTDALWCDEDEFVFHGILHTWRYGWGWTVAYSGCVVQAADDIYESVQEIAHANGAGIYEVDDDWDDNYCALSYVAGEQP